MIDRQALLTDLQKLLPKIEADLLERSESAEVPDVGPPCATNIPPRKRPSGPPRAIPNGDPTRSPRRPRPGCSSCVFVRFLEDNQLVPTPKIAGPGERLKRARDEHELYFRAAPDAHRPRLSARGLRRADQVCRDARTSSASTTRSATCPNWLSGDAAGALIAFFQRIDPNTGVLVHDFTDPAWDTRFLGDLYQDLSEAARKKYALLQTPVFVEEFILDRTLDPAIEEFGLAKMGYESRLLPDGRLASRRPFKMIDPACGSGHFLLGSFARLVDRWRKKEPATKTSVLVQRALDSVHGVDLNPFAIAIARFRLLLAALEGMRDHAAERCAGVRDPPRLRRFAAARQRPAAISARSAVSSIDSHVYQPEDPEALGSTASARDAITRSSRIRRTSRPRIAALKRRIGSDTRPAT